MLIGVLPGGRLSVYQRNFVRAMGLCADPQRIYLSAIAQVWRLENVLKQGQVANKQFDRLYVPRNAQTTGDLDIHEIAVDATTASCSSTPSIPVLPPSTPSTASGRCGSRASSASSRRRTVAI